MTTPRNALQLHITFPTYAMFAARAYISILAMLNTIGAMSNNQAHKQIQRTSDWLMLRAQHKTVKS